MYELKIISEIVLFPDTSTTKNAIANKIYIINNAFTIPYRTPPISLHCFINGNDVIASDTNVNNCNTALATINIISKTTILVIFTANVPAVSYTISFCVFVTASVAYFSK